MANVHKDKMDSAGMIFWFSFYIGLMHSNIIMFFCRVLGKGDSCLLLFILFNVFTSSLSYFLSNNIYITQ